MNSIVNDQSVCPICLATDVLSCHKHHRGVGVANRFQPHRDATPTSLELSFLLCRHLTLPDIAVGCPRRESKQTPNRDRRRQRTSSQNCTRPRTQAYQRASILGTNVGAGCSYHPTGVHIISGRAFLPILSDSVGWTLTSHCERSPAASCVSTT